MRRMSAPCLVMVLLFVCMSSLLLTRHVSQVVVFDRQAVVGKFIGQLSQHALNEDMIRQKSKQFSDALKVVLQDYAAKHHVLIMDKSATLAGGEDKTVQVIELVALYMRDKP